MEEPQVQLAIPFSRLKTSHPRLDVTRVRVLKAWYRGGNTLLGNQDILRRVYPMYTYETPHVYEERLSRAFYENNFGLIINQISAGLAQDPLSIKADVDDPPAPEHWVELMKNATHLSEDGSTSKSLDQVMRDATIEALVTGWAWLQAELPAPEETPASLREQEASGHLRAYVVPWATDQVTDWSEKKGRLLWIRTYVCEIDDTDPSKKRDVKKHVWVIWTATEWIRYEVLEGPGITPPTEDQPIPPHSTGPHSFGRVPWIRLDFSAPDGPQLHIGDQLESPCRNYFNRQNGESYQWLQFYYQQLYEFLGAEVAGIDTPISESQQDPGRARRRRAPGVVHVRGQDDRAEFIGPNMGGADSGQKALGELRDAIFRTTAQMALTQDTSGAMLRRSEGSKKQDSVATEIVLGSIGKRVITAANHLGALLDAGRKEAPESTPNLVGYQSFDIQDVEMILSQSVIANEINIPSATFQIEDKYNAAIAKLGDSATNDVKEKIRKELSEVITQDQLKMQNTYVPPPEESEVPPGDEEEEAFQ